MDSAGGPLPCRELGDARLSLACLALPCAGPRSPVRIVQRLLGFLMIKAVRLTLALAALAAPAALVAGCGGVPGNAVAEVDGQAIEKSDYDHWINVAARSSGQGASAQVPKPPEYTACVAAKRKTTPKPAKG